MRAGGGVAGYRLPIQRGSREDRCRLAVTLCRPEIFDAHFSRGPAHAPSFIRVHIPPTPVACRRRQRPISNLWQDQAVPLARRPSVRCDAGGRPSRRSEPMRDSKNVRCTGTITALELEARDSGYLAGIGPKLQAFFSGRKPAAASAWQHDLRDAGPIASRRPISARSTRAIQGCGGRGCRRRGVRGARAQAISVRN